MTTGPGLDDDDGSPGLQPGSPDRTRRETPIATPKSPTSRGQLCVHGSERSNGQLRYDEQSPALNSPRRSVLTAQRPSAAADWPRKSRRRRRRKSCRRSPVVTSRPDGDVIEMHSPAVGPPRAASFKLRRPERSQVVRAAPGQCAVRAER